MLSLTARPRSLAMVETRSTALDELGVGDLELLVVGLRDHARIVGEGAVDQLGGERDGADLEARLGGRHADRTVPSLSSIRRCSSCTVLRGRMMPGMPAAPFGARQLRLGQPVTVGRHCAQGLLLAALGGVQIDAVEVVARLLGGDGKARLVDQAFEVLGGDLELVAELARGKVGKVLRRQRLQGEAGMAGAQRSAAPSRHRASSPPGRRREACARCRAACAPAPSRRRAARRRPAPRPRPRARGRWP